MALQPAHTIPDVLQGLVAAFAANDPIGMAEAFAVNARLTTEYDAPLARAVGFDPSQGPVIASSAVGILRFYAYGLSMFDVKNVKVVSCTARASGLDFVCCWSLRLFETDREVDGFCHNRWRLDRPGRRVLRADSFCGLLPMPMSIAAN